MTIKLFKQPQDIQLPFRPHHGRFRVMFKQYYDSPREPSWSYRSFQSQEALERFVQGQEGSQGFATKKPFEVFFDEVVSHFAAEAAEHAVKGSRVSACTLLIDMGGKPLEFEFSALDIKHLQTVYHKQHQVLAQSASATKTEGPGA